jgi:hypothetical protein
MGGTFHEIKQNIAAGPHDPFAIVLRPTVRTHTQPMLDGASHNGMSGVRRGLPRERESGQ